MTTGPRQVYTRNRRVLPDRLVTEVDGNTPRTRIRPAASNPRVMSLLRALSSSARLACGHVARTAPATGSWAMGAVHAQTLGARIRGLASEPGFLDRAEVAERVLEVVRKFEKVRPNEVSRGKLWRSL
jgi:hypothetical protein